MPAPGYCCNPEFLHCRGVAVSPVAGCRRCVGRCKLGLAILASKSAFWSNFRVYDCGRNLAIWLLMLALSHAPIPWAHSHAGLSAEQLTVHAREFHPGYPLSKLPQGWHLHCFFQGATIGNISDAAIIDCCSTRLCEKSNSVAGPGSFDIKVINPRSTHRLVRLLDNRLQLHTYPSRDLFKKYGSFLN